MGAGAGCGRGQLFLPSLLLLLFLLAAPRSAGGQLRYAVPEELEHGAFVANLGEDLGLDVSTLSARRFRIVARAGARQHLEVNLENGILFVNERIDREEVCEVGGTCLLHLQLLVESPLELYRVEVEVLDINDHAPTFPWQEYVLEVAESAVLGARFPLESAQDPDVGTNSVHTYQLSPNGFFSLEVQTRSDASKFAELVLERALDREQQRTHRVLLTALDGGIPRRSGTAYILITVLDANDNVPAFDQPSYRVSLPEDAPAGTLVIQLNATDLDEGPNGEIEYSFSGHAPPRVRELFRVEPRSGQVLLKGPLDYERASLHELYVQAKDRGPSAVAVHCRVLVHLLDVNDNAPEVTLTSVSTPVQEDAPTGTVIAVISVLDRDSGDNGRVSCEISPNVPFELRSSFRNYYTLVTTEVLDREVVPEYNVSITARDMGSPALLTRSTLTIPVSDVNDNAPRFLQPSYSVYVMENNAPGASICSDAARQRLVVQVRDGGQPALSATMSLLLSVVETMPQTLSDFSNFSLPPEDSSSSPLTLYLLVSLGSISFTFLLAILILTAIRCRGEQRSWRRGCRCCPRPRSSPDSLKTSNLTAQPTASTAAHLDVPDGGPPGYCYKLCLGPESAQSDFMFLKPCSLPRNNEKGPGNLPAAGKQSRPGQQFHVSKQVKQPNTDWLPPSMQRPALKSSQSLEDMGEIRRALQKEHERLCTLVTPVSEFQKASAGANSIWAPQHSPLYPGHIPALDYQHNVYIPGTPTLLSSKDGPLFPGRENRNSFSTFGKRKKMTTYCDMPDSVVINNDLK
ncbi:Protocadherin-10-like protein [Aix galericulata]|nr:Protocadherin-10-like protein [Aix galericulata]